MSVLTKGMTRRFAWALGGLLLAAQLPAHAAVEYIHTDSLGTPVAITDSDGNVIQTSEYEPFGKLLNRPLTDAPGYTGHETDATTGMVYEQQRYYDPQIGRFLSADPLQPTPKFGSNYNRYWYGDNNPYRFRDLDGRCTGSNISNSDGSCASSGTNTTLAKAGDKTGPGGNLNALRAQHPGPQNYEGRGGPNPPGRSPTGVYASIAADKKGPSDTTKDETRNLVQTVIQMVELKRFGTGVSGQIFNGIAWAEVSPKLADLTMATGLADIDRYRATDGLHIEGFTGSLIDWRPVEWSNYGANNPNLTRGQVMENLIYDRPTH